MNKPLILIDIDHTLFDSETFKNAFLSSTIDILTKHNISFDLTEAEAVYTAHTKSHPVFVPEEFIAEILEAAHVKNDEARLDSRLDSLDPRLTAKRVKKEFFNILFDTHTHKTHLYEDTIEALKELENLGQLGIFSQGNEELQMTKLASIKHYFQGNRLHIVESKKDAFLEVFQQYANERVFFIDDALPVLFTVKKQFPSVTVIWMKRGKYARSQAPIVGFQPDATIENLKEAIGVVEKESK